MNDIHMTPTQAPNSTPTPLPTIHSWHYGMLISQERSQFYNDLIKENCKDKVVLEIGTGSGLLAALAIKHGAKKVICCEENPLLAAAAQKLFKRLNLEDKVQLIMKNSKDIKTDEIPPIDVILHELFGSDPFEEEMIPSLSDARRFLKKDGIFLPEKIQILYKPIHDHGLPEKLFFDDIELIEMGELLSQLHPSLRARNNSEPEAGIFALPEVTISELLNTPYAFTEVNDELIHVDAVEVSFLIIHQNHKLQAAQFKTTGERLHWFPLVFYKQDTLSNKVVFSLKEQNCLMML